MPETLEDQLERVQTAIAAIESRGQAVGTSGSQLQRGDLSTLYRRERDLLTRIRARDRGGRRGLKVVPSS